MCFEAPATDTRNNWWIFTENTYRKYFWHPRESRVSTKVRSTQEYSRIQKTATPCAAKVLLHERECHFIESCLN